MKLTAYSAIIILVIAAMLPLGYPTSATCLKNPSGPPCMRGGMVPGMTCPKQNAPQSAPFAQAKTNTGAKMPFCCNSVFQSDIMRNLQGIRLAERRRLSGIRQIFHRNVLENGNRHIIYDIIVNNPGIDQAGIAALSGVNNQTLRYHLGVLISFHKVTAQRGGTVVRFFENGGALTEMERQLATHMRSPMVRSILELIAATPGINQTGIADTLHITTPAVIWHIRKLTRDGLVQEERRGKTIHYTISPECVATYKKFADLASILET